MTSPPGPFPPGTVLGGRYALGARREDDGLTMRWTATDRVLAREVTVEALSPSAPGGAREAFLAAVAAAARLGHPAVAATYDSGVVALDTPGGDPALPYVVTERPRGTSLAGVVAAQGALPPARVVAIGAQLARAVAAAHDAGVVHGGIEPAAVLLGEDDRVKLSRFAAGGTRSRLRGDSAGAKAADIRDLGASLAVALAGHDARRPVSPRAEVPATPPELDELLVAAQTGGVETAADLATGLEHLDLADDAEPVVVREPTPVAGTPAVGPRAGRRRDAGANRPPARAGGRGATIGGIVMGLLLLVAVAVAAFALAGRGGPSSPGSTTSSTLPGAARAGLLAVSGGHSFNPLSPDDPAKHENEALIPKLYDGDPATSWSTLQYTTRNFGNLKSGTGVYIQFDGSHPLHQLTVTSATRGWTFSVYVAATPGADLAAWGKPVDAPVTVTADVTQVDLHGQRGAAVLVWITQLGDAQPYRAEIGELAVR